MIAPDGSPGWQGASDAAHLQDRPMRQSAKVELLEPGRVRCWFLLQGAGSGQGEDPLIVQPEVQDEALMMIGRVDAAMSSHKSAFGAASNGFFLGGQNVNSRPRNMDIPHELSAEVCQYNQLLDHLSLLTMGPIQG